MLIPMHRLKALLFLAVAPIFMAPGVAVAWYRARGASITMHPFLEIWVWGALLAGFSTVVWMTIVLLRGR